MPNTLQPALRRHRDGRGRREPPGDRARCSSRPDEALVVEVEPPQGLYWSYSIGNPWWETIDYGRHQSSLNGHQAVIDDDGVLRVVIAHHDPGIANWLDTAGHSEGPIILRCVRTDTAPVPTTRVVPFAEVATRAARRHATRDGRTSAPACNRRRAGSQ